MFSLRKKWLVNSLILLAMLTISSCAQLDTQKKISKELKKNTVTKSLLPAPADFRETGIRDVKSLMQARTNTVATPQTNLVDVSGASRFIKAGRLNNTALKEIISSLTISLRTKFKYELAGAKLENTLASAPNKSIYKQTLARSTSEGLHILQIAAVQYVSQPARLWFYGVVEKNGHRIANPDLDEVQSMLTEVLEVPAEGTVKFALADLESRVIRLSYSDPVQTLATLSTLGITILNESSQKENIDISQLPMVMALASPTPEQMGLVGGGESSGGGSDGQGRTMMPQAASKLEASTIGTPSSQILVLFDPAHPEQFGRVEKLLKTVIDLPARQVYVEGMVLEISQNGLKELGISADKTYGSDHWIAGGLNAGGAAETLNYSWDPGVSNALKMVVKLRALVRDGKAEVLSRPSVLTLDGRQATIRVGEDVPISKSQTSGVSTETTSFDFSYFPTGILLNIRPRVSADGKEVSMLIDTTVSATVPGKELIVSDALGKILGQAPTISNRRVQTYARIPDSTPLIIGGLVSKEQSETNDKVPFLGSIPLLGHLFSSTVKKELKREVIIVLTPYVLNDKEDLLRSMPKDEDLFDSSGHVLFRDAYRIRSGDVFDLTFLTQNQRLKQYTKLAQAAIENDFRLAESEPFSSFVGGRIPGEQILTERMIYDVIKRLGTAKKVNDKRIIFFDSKNRQKYDVQYLTKVLSHLSDSENVSDFLNSSGDKALALTFYYDRDLMIPGHLVSEPRAEAALVNCPDRKEWNKLLWDMNQPDKDGRRRYTILLNKPYDLKRLRRAIVIKRIIDLNGGEKNSTLDRFSAGRILPIPEMTMDSYSIIDADVARYFFHSELYYRAAVEDMEKTLTSLDKALGIVQQKGISLK